MTAFGIPLACQADHPAPHWTPLHVHSFHFFFNQDHLSPANAYYSLCSSLFSTVSTEMRSSMLRVNDRLALQTAGSHSSAAMSSLPPAHSKCMRAARPQEPCSPLRLPLCRRPRTWSAASCPLPSSHLSCHATAATPLQSLKRAARPAAHASVRALGARRTYQCLVLRTCDPGGSAFP